MSDHVEQGTPQWRMDRAGKIGASEFRAAIAMTEGGTYVSGPKKGTPKPVRRLGEGITLMRKKAFERRSGIPVHEIGGRSLSHGKDLEPYAAEEFEMETGLVVERGGFIVHPRYPFLGASPDGVITMPNGAKRGFESKCPLDEAVHIETLENGMPEDHVDQVQGGCMVTGFEGWYFVSFDARQAPQDRLYVQYVPRDDAYISGTLLPGLLQFEAELQAMLKRLDSRRAMQLEAA